MLSKLNSARNREDGFTLIELLVVVIIIGILAAIALPIFIDQQKVAIDASVKSDVRNSVTNITGAQAQKLGVAKAAISNKDTKVALTAIPKGSAAGTAATTVIATKASASFTNVPDLGAAYTLQGWNADGKQYLGTADANKGGYSFDSTTGQFTQAAAAAPTGGSNAGGSTGGGATGVSTATSYEDGDPNLKYGFGYTVPYYLNYNVSSDMARTGTNSYKTSYSGGAFGTAMTYIDSSEAVGKQYVVDGWYNATSFNAGDKLNVIFPGSSNSVDLGALKGGGWQHFNTTVTIPTDYAAGAPYIQVIGNGVGGTIYFDDMKVQAVK